MVSAQKTPTRTRGLRVAALLTCLVVAAGCRTVDPDSRPELNPAPGAGTRPRDAAAAMLPAPTASLVQVAVTAQPSNIHSPWAALPPQRRTSLGALVGRDRVLVTAMLVADAVFVELQRPAEGLRITARVIARDYECNLALLAPVGDADEFLDGLQPLVLDDPARVGDAVVAWQIEADGSPHQTVGQIARIDVGSYPPYDRGLLRYRFQGSLETLGDMLSFPAVRGGRLTGLFLADTVENQAATILPAPLIRRFLEDVERDAPQGFPHLGIVTERTTDVALRRHLGLGNDVGGAYVARVLHGSPAAAAELLPGDVILSVDGHPIDRRTYYDDPDFGPLAVTHWIAGRSVAGDRLRFEIWRDRQAHSIEVPVERRSVEREFIPSYRFDQPPRYVIHGGLLFTELTRPYLEGFRRIQQAPVLLRHAMAHPEKYAEGRERLVILPQIIPTQATVGYERVGQRPVEEVNGVAVGSIREVYEALKHPVDGRHVIRLHGSPLPLYLDAEITERVNGELEARGVTPLRQLD